MAKSISKRYSQKDLDYLIENGLDFKMFTEEKLVSRLKKSFVENFKFSGTERDANFWRKFKE